MSNIVHCKNVLYICIWIVWSVEKQQQINELVTLIRKSSKNVLQWYIKKNPSKSKEDAHVLKIKCAYIRESYTCALVQLIGFLAF